MRWSELKKKVDQELETLGVEDPDIFVIDVSGFGVEGDVADISVSLLDKERGKGLYVVC